MVTDFIIPLKKEDLLSNETGCYSLELIPFSDADVGVRDLKFSIEKDGCETILEHFNVCFSFLYEADELTLVQLKDFYEDIVDEYMKKLCPYVKEAIDFEPSGKNRAVNTVKMLLYLFSMFHRTYEEKLSRQNDNLISQPKKNRMPKVKGNKRAEESWSWYDKKLESFSVIYCFLQMPIFNLWQNRIAEDSLINLIGGCCFKTFENTEINLIKFKPLRDSVSQVLSILVANYNYTLTFIPRSIEIMKQFEHVASAISSTVLIMHRDFQCHTLLEKFIVKLLEITIEDSQNLGKPVSVFISELGETNPELFVNIIDILKDFLSVDAYSVRNAVMVTLCEIVLKCFNEGNSIDNFIGMRNEILKLLQLQINDENAYVRSKVVQLWTKLALSSCIPINRYLSILRSVTSRLLDKSTNVSKYAIHFFTTVLEHNPYGGNLRLSELEKEKDAETAKLKELMKKPALPPDKMWLIMEIKIVNAVDEFLKDKKKSNELPEENSEDIGNVIYVMGNLIKKELYIEALTLLQMSETVFPESREIRCNMDKTDEKAYYVTTLRKIYLRAAELFPDVIVPDYYEKNSQIETISTAVDYLTNCTDFVECINKSADIIYQLMFSTNNSEILESVEFFSKAYKFQIGNSDKAIRDMLLLINSNTPELKDAVAKAYSCLYLETSKTEPRARAAQIAQRLINLVKGLDLEQKSALEEILRMWIELEKLDKEFISVLLKTAVESPQRKNILSDTNASLILINIVAGVNIAIVSSNLSYYKKMLDPNFDNYTVKLVCSLLQKLGSIKKNNKPIKYKKDNEIFQLVANILLKKYTELKEPEFINMAFSIIDLIFQLCYKPEELSNEILIKLYIQLLADTKLQESKSTDANDTKVNENLLDRLFQICGHIVFRKWQYCDKDVFRCLKRCQDGIGVERQMDQSLDEYEMEADNVVAADDALYEEITAVCDSFLSTEDTIVHHICNLVVLVCQSHDDNISPALKARAAMTLAKFMMTSTPFCKEKFQLYITMMDRSKYEDVRSNLVLGFGDLLCRFPNIAEPWTPYIYSRLKDHSESVRMNAVSVLCHLISREMVKIRGQFAELLLHMEDTHPIVGEKVKNLLLDLSRKGNTVYNVIPDIISKLSNPDRSEPVSSSTFKLIIGRLFELITKERQSDLLVEKLCLRLRESTNQRQWEDLAYCLSQIKYSEKSLRKLSEAFSTFAERLHHPPVYDTVVTIISTCSKSTKTSLKEVAREATAKLEEVMTVKEGEKTMEEVEKNKQTPDDGMSAEGKTESGEEQETTVEQVTPVKPIPKTREIKRTATKEPKTVKSKKNNQPTGSQSVTRSTRKKKTIKYDFSDEDD